MITQPKPHAADLPLSISPYIVEVIRDGAVATGPGRLMLWKMEPEKSLVGSWECITGGDELDPQKSGGLCPPINWNPVEVIAEYQHPTNGQTIDGQRLLCREDARKAYPQRTFSIHQYPFYIRSGDSSTGSIVITDATQWAECKAALENAFKSCYYGIQVRNNNPAPAEPWFVHVKRKLEPYGPGFMYIYHYGSLMGKFEVITGQQSPVDPHEYGGLTPPIDWVPIETLEVRKGTTGTFRKTRIIPLGMGVLEYPKRTFSIHEYPFMIHSVGNSTGCIDVRTDWDECYHLLNRGFAEYTWRVRVENSDNP